MLFGALSLLGFAYAREEPTGRALAGWAIASALAIATHYYAFFLVLVEAVWLAVLFRRRVVPAIVAVTAVGLALLPLALHQRGLDLANYLRDISLGGRLARVPKQFLVGLRGAGRARARGGGGACSRSTGVVLALRAGHARERSGALVAGVLAVVALLLPLPIDPDTFGTRNSLAVVAAGDHRGGHRLRGRPAQGSRPGADPGPRRDRPRHDARGERRPDLRPRGLARGGRGDRAAAAGRAHRGGQPERGRDPAGPLPARA